MNILTVIVTHNRRDLLSRCLDHVHLQTRPSDQVLVIDNASTDGTVEMLERRGTPYVTQENVGSAGGWQRGIGHALEHGYDAVWLMDDDGYPDSAALEALERALAPGVACASSVVVREDDPAHFVFPFPLLDAKGLPVLFAHPRKVPTLAGLQALAPSGEYPFAHLFNGALVSMQAVRRAGNVDANFFMYGDEVDFFFRLRAHGPVVSMLGALHYHPDVTQRPYTLPKVYYFLKNQLVLNNRYFNAVWIRHAAVVVAVLGRTAHRNGWRWMLSLVVGPSAGVFYGAIVKGLRGQIGKDFRG